MSTLKKFEDIEAWQLARELCKCIHILTLKPAFSKDFGLIRQIKNTSGSVMDNIVEGFEREGNSEFKQFLSISKGSCGESQSQLYRALDCDYISEDEFKQAYEKAEHAKAKIKALMTYLQSTTIKGNKFKA